MSQLKFLWMSMFTHLKVSMASRTTFILTICITVLKQVLFLTGWKFFFEKYQMVEGWRFDHMLVMYGTACFGAGWIDTFCYGLKELPNMIITSQIDNFLLQPKNIILNVSFSKGNVSSISEVITGIIIIAYSGFLLSALPTIITILTMSVFFLFALYLYLSSLAFFINDAQDFIKELIQNALIMAGQPMAAYHGVLKMLTFSLLPVAFMSYFPIEFIRTGLWRNLCFSVLGTFIFFMVACRLFYSGLKRYESGNLLIFRQ